jgi:hypothetical protein
VQGIDYFSWLVGQTVTAVFSMHCFGVTLLVVLLLVLSWWASPGWKELRGRGLFWRCALPVLIPFATLICGAACAYTPAGPRTVAGIAPDLILEVLFWAHLPLWLLLVWRTGRYALFVTACSLWWAYCSMVAGFFASMSVTGDWL